jgi:SAM-dependent methyltransferase
MLPDDYGSAYYEGNGQSGDRPALRLYQRLARRHFPAGPVLDFGCGTGYLLRRLSKNGPADGLEAHEHGARLAAELVPSARVVRDLAELPDAHYAGVVAIHVVEHIDDAGLADVLAEWRRILTVGGRVLVATPDLSGVAHQLKGAAWGAFDDPTHINLKGHADWAALFRRHGFEVLRSAADGLWDFPYPPQRHALVSAARRAWPTAYQFLRGDLLLRPGSGEAALLLLQRAPDPS